MSINTTSTTVRRTAAHEAQDTQQLYDNVLARSWEKWPNEAGFAGLEEHRGPINLHVKGSIPPWAAGALYRTGPGMSQVDDTARGTHYVSHWFDGLAHTHKFDILPSQTSDTSNGHDDSTNAVSVTYSSRRQSDDVVDTIRRNGWRLGTTFGQKADPCVGLFAKATSAFESRRHNNNVTVLPNFPGLSTRKSSDAGARTATNNVFLGTDNTVLQEIHPDTLEPVGRVEQRKLHPLLTGPLSSAHAQRDPITGDWFNYNLVLGRTPTYHVFRTNAATGTTDILASVSGPDIRAAYIHSLFLTANYVVLCVPTSHYGLAGIKIAWEHNVLDAIKPFDKNVAAQWVVVDRHHGRGVVARFSTPAGFFFHTINAFEEVDPDTGGTALCFDHVLYDSTDVMFSFYYDVLLDRRGATQKHWLGPADAPRYKNNAPHLVRYRHVLPASATANINKATKTNNTTTATATEVFSIPGPHVGELPTINPAYACRPYRYVYTASTRGLSTLLDCLAKTDLQTRETLIWSGPEGHSPGEAIFVARPTGARDGEVKTSGENGNVDSELDEDDGVLLSVVLDGKAGTSYLLCLNARTMEEVGRAEADFAIGIGFHGAHAAAV